MARALRARRPQRPFRDDRSRRMGAPDPKRARLSARWGLAISLGDLLDHGGLDWEPGASLTLRARRFRRMPPSGDSYDTLVIGAGFAGSVIAERLASQLGQRVLVVDRRAHIGGNAFDQ